MQLRYLIVTGSPGSGWQLQWAIDGIDSTKEITLERASSPEGPWEKRATVDYNTVAFEDYEFPNKGHFTQMFFRLTVHPVGNPAVVDLQSNPTSLPATDTQITREIIRQHELVLKGVNGHPGFFSRYFACYKHTKNGTVCQYCTDPETGEKGLLAHCTFCGGTGYTEGYANPILFRGTWRDSEGRMQSTMAIGPREELQRTLWTSVYPVFEPGDVVVEKNGRVYEVASIHASEPGGYLVSQTLTVSAIDPQHIAATLSYPS